VELGEVSGGVVVGNCGFPMRRGIEESGSDQVGCPRMLSECTIAYSG